MVGRWKREYKLKSVDFIKKRVLSLESQETQEFKNQKSRTNNQELRTRISQPNQLKEKTIN